MMMMVPESRVDEAPIADPSRPHEMRTGRNTAEGRRASRGWGHGQPGSSVNRRSRAKSALGLEAGRKGRNRPHYRKCEQAVHP